MEKLIQQHVGFQVLEVKKLSGYDNTNYRVKSESANFIFKTYPYEASLLDILKAENEVLHFLNEKTQGTFPKPVPFPNGEYIRVVHIGGEATICRMLTYLDGDFLGTQAPTPETYASLGNLLAQTDLRLREFKSYILKARHWEWDIQYLPLNKKHLDDIPDPHDRNIVRYFFQQFEQNVVPILPELRKQVIYNDANEWNILVKGGRVSGLIDFGDLAYSPLINEVAVALTYACYDKESPLEWVPPLLAAYHKVLPLEEREIKILYYLIAARLCISVCNSAYAKKANPDNTYATVSETYAWNMLYKWLATNPIAAENVFRNAVGLPIPLIEDIEKEIERRHRHISPILSMSYNRPISMARAAFQYMYDTRGNAFLDAYNNIPHVGHSHPKVVDAGQRQMALLNTNTRYLYDALPAYAEKLLAKFPPSLNKVYFVNSGSAASDLAVRLATFHTRHSMLVVMEHGYHGNTQTSMEISDYKFSNKKGAGRKEHILKVPLPDTYRGTYTQNDGSAGRAYAREAIALIEQAQVPPAAFIAEPIVGCGGQVPLAQGYLPEVYAAIRKRGGVCISDEVQTGFGRLGDHFWGFEAQGVVPDLVILGKPMGNGHPMGAVVTTAEIAESFEKGVEFFSSFGGNPVSCAIGLSVLDVIQEEHLQENAKAVGDYYQSLFRELQAEYACMGDVRGSGLFLGVELIKNSALEPATELAHFVKNELRNQNILISTDGPYDSVLKTKPPLCFTQENAERVVETVREALKVYF